MDMMGKILINVIPWKMTFGLIPSELSLSVISKSELSLSVISKVKLN
jgi:hypothetical protein